MGTKGVSLPLLPIRPRWFHTFCLPMCWATQGWSWGHVMMWARFGSQGSTAVNWHSRYSGTRYSGTWLYLAVMLPISWMPISWCLPFCIYRTHSVFHIKNLCSVLVFSKSVFWSFSCIQFQISIAFIDKKLNQNGIWVSNEGVFYYQSIIISIDFMHLR